MRSLDVHVKCICYNELCFNVYVRKLKIVCTAAGGGYHLHFGRHVNFLYQLHATALQVLLRAHARAGSHV